MLELAGGRGSWDDPEAAMEYDRRPLVLVFGDDPERRRRLGKAVALAGARALDGGEVAEMSSQMALRATGSFLIDIDSRNGENLDGLLANLANGSSSGVIVADRHLIDHVARWPRLMASLLIEPGDAEIAAAIGDMATPPPAAVHDGVVEANGRRLQDLRDELGRIARTLTTLSGSIDAAPPMASPRTGADLRARAARSEIRQRRLRGRFFDAALFADPAWDMLLDLAASENERRRVAVSSLCIASAVPATTALRWISQMTDQGLLVREPDPDDRRRVFIQLSAPARTAMDRYLDAVAAAEH